MLVDRKKQCIGIFLMVAFLVSFSALAHSYGKLIVVMGPSCAGKSTLPKRLLNHLGTHWHLLEFDAIEDACKRDKIPSNDNYVIHLRYL